MILLILLNIVWAGLAVLEGFVHYWFIIPATIIIEMFLIKRFTGYGWGSSFLMSFMGNFASGVVGTVLMGFASIVVDIFGANIVCAWLLMLLGSFGIEYWVVKQGLEDDADMNRKLFWAILIGNVLSYLFIAVYILIRHLGGWNEWNW